MAIHRQLSCYVTHDEAPGNEPSMQKRDRKFGLRAGVHRLRLRKNGIYVGRSVAQDHDPTQAPLPHFSAAITMLGWGLLTAIFTASTAATTFGLSTRDIVANDGVKCACNQLEAAYPDALLRPNSTDYNTQRINVWDKRSNLSPACIFLPKTTESAAAAIGIFNNCGAQFAIRGGGHMNVSSNVLPLMMLLTCRLPGARVELHQ